MQIEFTRYAVGFVVASVLSLSRVNSWILGHVAKKQDRPEHIHPAKLPTHVWKDLIKDRKDTKNGGWWIGLFECWLCFAAFSITDGYPIIAGWLAFKVASKWAAWQHIVKVPDKIPGDYDLEWYAVRSRLASWLLTRFQVGTLINVIIGMIAAGAGFLSSDLFARPQDDSSKQQAQIELRLKEIFDAAEKKDLSRLDGYHFYGPKFTKYSASSTNRLDAEASRKGEHDGLAAITDLKMQADELKIDVFGDVGIATFLLNSSFKAGTNVVEKKERSTLAFVKEGGAWKITHEHFSPIKAAQ